MKIKLVIYISAVILALLPTLYFLLGIRDFRRMSLFSYAVLTPYVFGSGLVRGTSEAKWVLTAAAIVCALATWLPLASAVAAFIPPRRSHWPLRTIGFSTLFIFLYGVGAWGLYEAWHAP